MTKFMLWTHFTHHPTREDLHVPTCFFPKKELITITARESLPCLWFSHTAESKHLNKMVKEWVRTLLIFASLPLRANWSYIADISVSNCEAVTVLIIGSSLTSVVWCPEVANMLADSHGPTRLLDSLQPDTLTPAGPAQHHRHDCPRHRSSLKVGLMENTRSFCFVK